MARSATDVIKDMDESLKLSGKELMTISWSDFYDLNDISKFKDGRNEALRIAAKGRGLIIGFGLSAVSVCHDRNFAPL